MTAIAPTRRDFLVGALVVAFAGGRTGKAFADSSVSHKDIGGFVRVAADGQIFLVMPSVEMGQGIYTAEAALLSEELDVRLDQIQAIAAPPDPSLYAQPLFKAQFTGGSTSIRGFWRPLREAGAAARTVLVEAAARRWHVSAEDCSTNDGVITHLPTRRKLTYGDVAQSASVLPLPLHPRLKAPADFKIIGTSQPRIDTPHKVDGSAVFGIDVALDGMKVAAVTICPVDGGSLKSLDSTKALKLPGVVTVLTIDDAVAVVGENYWAARKGADALRIQWDLGPHAKISSASIRADAVRAAFSGTAITALDNGEVGLAMAGAALRISAEYEMPFLAHATMEPINTTVHVHEGACDIWVGTQTPAVAQRNAARILGIPLEKVALHNQLLGGGFGRRLQADTIDQAVRFAKQVPFPLKVIWTREQDIQHDHFRPYYLDRLSAGLDKQGNPIAWKHRTISGTVRQFFSEAGWPQGTLDKDAVDGAWDTPYAFPSIKVEWVRNDPPVKLNWWRGVGPTHNVFVVESFLDELAAASGQDPIEYRRNLVLRNSRALAVLNKVEDASDWERPLAPRSGRGVSLHQNFGSFAALVVEVAVDDYGEVRLKRIVAAVDCGIQINPDTVRAQIEGGVLFGLSAALFNGITLTDGRVDQSNFHDYRQLRINETPPIEVHTIASGESPGGLGEVGTVSAAPALANAIFAATGVRLRKLPIDRTSLAKKATSR